MLNLRISNNVVINDSVKIFLPEDAEVILGSDGFKKMNSFVQHGNTSCMLHSIAVAYFSLRLAHFLAKNFNIKYNKHALAFGALLHDYFLYDWHIKDTSHRFHGFTHPMAALTNARLEYSLSSLEEDIVLRHMFPLTLIPPKHRESFIVCLVDKICSVYEIFARSPYQRSICTAD